DASEAKPVSATSDEPATLTALRELFQRLSGVDVTQADPSTSFYELGFDSLFLTQASQAVTRTFGVDVTFRQLREEFTTLAKLAERLDALGTRQMDARPVRGGREAETSEAERTVPLTDV